MLGRVLALHAHGVVQQCEGRLSGKTPQCEWKLYWACGG